MTKQLTMNDLLAYSPRGQQDAPPPATPLEEPGFNPFEFEGQAIRVGMLDGEPIWASSDVAKALGYVDTDQAARQHCKRLKLFKPVELTGMGILNPPPRGLNMIREPDLYRLIINSHLPAADRFEQWVFETVLPTIRKTGGYSVRQSLSGPKQTAVALSNDGIAAVASAIGGVVRSSAPYKVMQSVSLVAHQGEDVLKRLTDIEAAMRYCGMVRPDQVTKTFLPMCEVAKRESVTARGVVHRMSISMRNWCMEQNRQMCVRRQLDVGGRFVFHIEAIDDWMIDKGRAILEAARPPA